MMPIAHLVELAYKLFSRYGMHVPQLTPSRIRLLSCNRTFSCTKARVQLDYEPIVPLKEGLKRTVDSYSYLRAVPRSGASKASIILGSGNIANTLLWKDTKQALATLLLMAIFLLLLVCIWIFLHHSSGKASFSGRSILVRSQLATYQSVVIILLFLSILGAMSLQSIFKIGVPLLFVGFVAYEKWEDEIYELSSKASTHILKLKSDAVRKFTKH